MSDGHWPDVRWEASDVEGQKTWGGKSHSRAQQEQQHGGRDKRPKGKTLMAASAKAKAESRKHRGRQEETDQLKSKTQKSSNKRRRPTSSEKTRPEADSDNEIKQPLECARCYSTGCDVCLGPSTHDANEIRVGFWRYTYGHWVWTVGWQAVYDLGEESGPSRISFTLRRQALIR